MKSPLKHIELLDYIRGIAIISVLLFHTLGDVFGYDVLPWKGWHRDFSGAGLFSYFLPLSFGQAGVAIFFVVSGFCIHLSFHQQGQAWGAFFIRRIFRIYPAYLMALLFSVLLFAAHSRLDFHSRDIWVQLLTHLFLVNNYNPATFFGINPSFWSLALEAQLYLLYPLLLFLVARFGWRRAMMILAACELLIRGADGLNQTLNANNALGSIFWVLASSPLGYWFSWALGAFVADALLKDQPLPFLKTSPCLWFTLAITSYFAKPLYPFLFCLFAVTTAAVTSRLLSGKRTITRAPVLQKVGLWSYSIYLLHQPLLNVCSSAITWLVPQDYRSAPMVFLLILLAWLVVIPFSVLWYKLFELPGMAAGKWIIQQINIGNVVMFGADRLRQVQGARLPVFSLMAGALLFMTVGFYVMSAKWTLPPGAEINNLAWSFATNPDASKRNGALAVKLAEEACQRTQYRETIVVGTLAAAYAEDGRFYEAIATAQKACELAKENGETNLLERNQELLGLYLNHQPYHEREMGAGK